MHSIPSERRNGVNMNSAMLYIYCFSFALAAICTRRANCQDNYFKISSQFRVRPEFRHGYKTLSPDTSSGAFFISQRARLIFDYKKDNITLYTSVQDIRTWGDEEPLKDNPGLSVNELWVELGLKKNFFLKLGRQELVYDDHRLLGNLDWANSTRSHDALVIKYIDKQKKFNWHFGGAYNQSGEPLFETGYNLKNYKFLVFSWLKKEFKNSSLSATAIVNGLSSAVANSGRSKASFTFGPLYNFQNNNFKALLGTYYQTGKTENNLLLGSYMINAYGELHNKQLLVGIGFDYLSGNKDNTPVNRSHSFSTLYATNHKFYGYMDYFTNIPADTKQHGLIDPYLRIGVVSAKSLRSTLDVHHFYLANTIGSGLSKMQKRLGDEFDLLMEYQPSAIINVQAGYSMMFATKSMEVIKGGNNKNYNGWAFIVLKVSPTFFLYNFKN